ncbi:MAG: SIMPL domain-containing protein [Hyphomonadaceae bacterium JAD_PAG50586_4]|nr:MAG: SIMPL domain-containing protein [Hyphomonadaceae bacterium JAD_PAG50586_4]
MELSSPLRGAARLICAGLALAALGACGQRATLLTVHASATTRAAPDLAIVTIGVLARGANAQAAQQAQATRMADVMSAARAAGVPEADVQTIGYSIEPQYVYPRNASPRITGYVSRNIVSIRVPDVNAVSALIDATVAEGANELHGIQFTYRDEEASREAARAQALATAQARANAYAEAAGMRVVRMDSITEPGGIVPPYEREQGLFAARAVAPEQSANGAIAPGQVDNQASVTVVFELRG